MAMPSETDALVWGRASFLRGQLLNASFRTLVANVAERWYLENLKFSNEANLSYQK
jgi:hypothetical protein